MGSELIGGPTAVKLKSSKSSPSRAVSRSLTKRMPAAWCFSALAILVAYLSIAPVLNLVSGRQLMNYSYDPLDLVNTYGAFGTVGRERDEIIFEGTEDSTITGDTKWKEYGFKAKPGDPNKKGPDMSC